MTAIIKQQLGKSVLQSIYDGALTKSSRYFYYVGRNTNELTDTPEQTYSYELITRKNIAFVKQLSVNDISFVVRRIDWATGIIYDMYDDSVEMEELDFYVMTGEYNVYKCIFNNGGTASTVMPTGSDEESQTYADGYIWKFMYNIPVALRNKFMTSDYIPVMISLTNQFYSNGSIETVTIQNGGTGYTTATATIAGDGSFAAITPIISGGQITGYTIDNPGYDYTWADIVITGNGTDAELIPNLSIGDINTLQANVEMLAVNGSIEAVKMITNGSDYTTATVTIIGDGTGATATATISSGQITKIIMNSIGSDYTWATIIITGDGTGATARPIISPKGGHGKNAVNELFADKLMFIATLSSEKNQGITVANEFRQVGIIKNITEYNSASKYRFTTGSACFKITGTINTSLFPINSILYRSTTGKRFIVVESETNSLLVQPLDDELPINGQVYRNEALNSFTATTVTEPTIDRYSGEMICIDNNLIFTPSVAEAVTLRTILEI